MGIGPMFLLYESSVLPLNYIGNTTNTHYHNTLLQYQNVYDTLKICRETHKTTIHPSTSHGISVKGCLL